LGNSREDNQVLSEVSRQYYSLIQVLPYMQKNPKHTQWTKIFCKQW